jgi:hypothetical protein
MKRNICLLLILPLLILSCNKIPEVRFNIDAAEPEVGQKIIFNNGSKHATRFEWDFGDGFISTDENPEHVYNVTGTFEATLTAFSKSGQSDKAYLTIQIFAPTLLQIEVLEYYKEYAVANANVRLFPDSTSWDKEENLIIEGYTDKDGIIIFSNLEQQIFYVDVWEANHNNYVLRAEDVRFIMTDPIVRHKINWFIAWVDNFSTGKGEGKRNKSYIIKKIERKLSDKERPAAKFGSNDWELISPERWVHK